MTEQKLQVKTLKFQEMVSRAQKGAGNNKMIPITSLICIEATDNQIVLTTTNATEYLHIVEEVPGIPEFYAVLQLDQFAKLVAKTTAETITLVRKENEPIISFTGNGSYSIRMPLDEEGDSIVFPTYNFDLPNAEKKDVHISAIRSVLASNKISLAENMEEPVYTAYYFGEDAVITTNLTEICYNKIAVFGKPLLLSAECVNLLSNVTKETVEVYSTATDVLFKTSDCVIYSHIIDGLASYNVEAVMGLIGAQFSSKCSVPKAAMLGVIDRILLFVETYDENAISLNFNQDGLYVSSKADTGVEVLKYQTSEGWRQFSCLVDANMMKRMVSSQEAEVINIHYGHPVCLKLVNGNVTQLTALLEDSVYLNGGE